MNGKLVRDNIPNIIAAETGKSATVKILTDQDYLDSLHAKLDEEVAEFHESGDIEELVDVYEVVLALAALKDTTPGQLRMRAEAKREIRGSFRNRYFLVQEDT